jgi:hypothetical protein
MRHCGPLYLRDSIQIPRRGKQVKTLKERGTLFQEDPNKKFFSVQPGALAHHHGVLAQPVNLLIAASAKDRDKPVMRNLPEVTSRTSLLGLNSSDTPVQRASSSSTPAEGKGLRHLSSGMGRLHLAKTKLPDCTRRKLKKARACKAGTGAPSNQGESRHA